MIFFFFLCFSKSRAKEARHFLQCGHILQGNKKTSPEANTTALPLVVDQLNECHFFACTNMSEIPSASAGRLGVNDAASRCPPREWRSRTPLPVSAAAAAECASPLPPPESAPIPSSSLISHIFLHKAPSFLSATSENYNTVPSNKTDRCAQSKKQNKHFTVITEASMLCEILEEK